MANRPDFLVPPGFDPQEPWDRVDRLREDVKNDDLMSGVPHYQKRYSPETTEAVHLLGLALDLLLENHWAATDTTPEDETEHLEPEVCPHRRWRDVERERLSFCRSCGTIHYWNDNKPPDHKELRSPVACQRWGGHD